MKDKGYQSYLRSKKWQRLAIKVRRRDNNQCGICASSRGSNILHVHHITYKRLYAEKLTDLIALCSICHKEQHQFIKTLTSQGKTFDQASSKALRDSKKFLSKRGGSGKDRSNLSKRKPKTDEQITLEKLAPIKKVKDGLKGFKKSLLQRHKHKKRHPSLSSRAKNNSCLDQSIVRQITEIKFEDLSKKAYKEKEKIRRRIQEVNKLLKNGKINAGQANKKIKEIFSKKGYSAMDARGPDLYNEILFKVRNR